MVDGQFDAAKVQQSAEDTEDAEDQKTGGLGPQQGSVDVLPVRRGHDVEQVTPPGAWSSQPCAVAVVSEVPLVSRVRKNPAAIMSSTLGKTR